MARNKWSRQTYTMVAEEINYIRSTGGDKDTVERMAFVLAHRFEQDNPAFSRDRFYAACGVNR